MEKKSYSRWLLVGLVAMLGWCFCIGCQARKRVETEKVVKILAIGNSFSQDAVEQYLHELAEADGRRVIIGNMYIGGCSLERHLRNARADAPAYYYRKIGLDGKKVERKNVKLNEALQDEKWDFISFQQASPFSGMYDTYVASLPELVEYVRKRVSGKTRFMLHQTWAYASNSTHSGFKNYGNDQMRMYSSIVEAVRKAEKLVHIKTIIPSGTAIQNARTSFLGDTMNRDGYHLNLSYGRYTAACTWYEKLFGQNVIGNSFCPKGVPENVCRTVQTAAHEAVKHPFKITDLSKLR